MMEKSIEITQCYLTLNDCYKTTRTIKPAGICVHSTGANNPYVRRYVQPAATNSQSSKLKDILGVNKYSNDWNHPNIDKCVHAFVGKFADEKVHTVQTLPWTKRGWHAGSGKLGSLNDTHISFEICEDSLTNADYFLEAMAEAINLCAFLCEKYKLDPMKNGVLICHSEGYRMGKASQHGDIEHWLKKFGLDMNWFRDGVKKAMNKEEENVDNIKCSNWAQESVKWARENGLTNDTTFTQAATKEEIIEILYRYNKMIGGNNNE